MNWRAERLGNLWNWLIAFRAVAETEHLPSASAALSVSPSALSRTIRLLEEEVEQKLFDRVGRGIVLNNAGQTLLIAVRNAMRLTDEGISILKDQQFAGPVTVAVSGPFAPLYVLPALAPLRLSHPELVVQVTSLTNVNDRLLQGRIDLALVDDPVVHDELLTEQLDVVTHGIYCASGHPLYRRRRITIEDIVEHPFAAPIADSEGRTPDQWPEHVPRTVGVRVMQMQVGIEACADGSYLIVLPDRIGKRASLRRLPIEFAGATTMFAVRRTMLPVESRADIVLAAVQRVVERLR